mgnify:CR=1 FL=1
MQLISNPSIVSRRRSSCSSAMVTRLRAEQAKAADDNARLTHEIAALRAQLADSEGVTSEIDDAAR